MNISLTDVCRRMCASLREYKPASEYIASRGISNFTVDDLSIGYCNYNSYEELGVNLCGRVVFPIKGIDGDVIGFGGRVLGDEIPKYLNSPASEIYDKSRVVYNLDNASDYILDSGFAIVVEGYMDVAALWEAGIRNAIATCGTAITRWHLRALKRYADEVFLLYDDDKAGRAATERALAVAEMERYPVFAVPGLLGMDPDEYVNMMGVDSLTELINGARKTKEKAKCKG